MDDLKEKLTEVEHALNYHPDDSELTSKLEDVKWRLEMAEETLEHLEGLLENSASEWESHQSGCDSCGS